MPPASANRVRRTGQAQPIIVRPGDPGAGARGRARRFGNAIPRDAASKAHHEFHGSKSCERRGRSSVRPFRSPASSSRSLPATWACMANRDQSTTSNTLSGISEPHSRRLHARVHASPFRPSPRLLRRLREYSWVAGCGSRFRTSRVREDGGSRGGLPVRGERAFLRIGVARPPCCFRRGVYLLPLRPNVACSLIFFLALTLPRIFVQFVGQFVVL